MLEDGYVEIDLMCTAKLYFRRTLGKTVRLALTAPAPTKTRVDRPFLMPVQNNVVERQGILKI